MNAQEDLEATRFHQATPVIGEGDALPVADEVLDDEGDDTAGAKDGMALAEDVAGGGPEGILFVLCPLSLVLCFDVARRQRAELAGGGAVGVAQPIGRATSHAALGMWVIMSATLGSFSIRRTSHHRLDLAGRQRAELAGGGAVLRSNEVPG